MPHHIEVVEERFWVHGSRESTSQAISGSKLPECVARSHHGAADGLSRRQLWRDHDLHGLAKGDNHKRNWAGFSLKHRILGSIRCPGRICEAMLNSCAEMEYEQFSEFTGLTRRLD
jgi:hypothetical protein